MGYLSESLQARVIGATYEFAEMGDFFAHLSRGKQVVLDVQRRRPSAWLSWDDDQIGWPKRAEKHALFTDPYEGIGEPEVHAKARERLAAQGKS